MVLLLHSWDAIIFYTHESVTVVLSLPITTWEHLINLATDSSVVMPYSTKVYIVLNNTI